MANWLKWLHLAGRKTTDSDRLQHNLTGPVPTHIAIIMDGNGRWAQKRGLPRLAGHKAGADAIRDIVRFCAEIDVKMLTLYAFSTENWNRPKDEVEGLMKLLLEYLGKETEALHENGVRIHFLGDMDELPAGIQKAVQVAQEYTEKNTRLQLNIALNYGSRPEMVRAVRHIAKKYEDGEIGGLDDITEQTVSDHLFTAGMPDPDLIIRPGKEMRLSNFLLWQSAYAEFYPVDVLWPDFKPEHLRAAIAEYSQRDRRFGSIKVKAGDRTVD